MTAPLLSWLAGLALVTAAAPSSAPLPQRAYAERAAARLAEPTIEGVERLELMLEQARALMTWHVPSALEVCRRAAAEAREQGRDDYLALVLAIEARGLARTEGSLQASELMQQARDLMPPEAAVELRGRLCLIDVGLLYVIDEYGLAAAALDRGMELAKECGSQRLLADCLLELHDLLDVTGTGNDPIDDLHRAKSIFEELDDPRGLLRVRLRMLDVWRAQGHDDTEVAAELAALDEQARTMGDRAVQIAVRGTRYGDALHVSDYETAIRTAQESLELSRALACDEQVAWSTDQLAWAHLLAGRPDEAAPLIDEALAIMERLDLSVLEHAIVESAVELALARQDAPALLAHSQRLADLVRRSHERVPRGEAPARIVLQELQRERRALNEEQRESERRVAYYRSLAAGIALFSTSILAVVFFVGKRRVERANRRLVEQTELARRTEEDRKRLEEHLAQIERLDGIGLLSAGVAHDFNNILCCIAGNTELLLDSCEGRRRAMAESVLQASRRGSDLCKRLLDYARPSPANRAVVDLRDIAAETRTLLEVASCSATLRLELGPVAAPAEVDRSAIEQVLVNLVTNAQDASVEASVVTVSVHRRETLDSSGTGPWFGQPADAPGYAVLEVGDDGIGLQDAQLRRIFDPFFTTKFEGRGLGLSAAYGIVTSHGGAFCVTSRPGEGTTFAAYFPVPGPGAQAPRAEPFEIPRRPEAPTRRARVLVVDDDPSILALVENVLSSAGHEVEIASSAPEADRILRTRGDGFDVLLLDLAMPAMDGVELVTMLRRRGEDVPVILMSGHDEGSVKDRVGGESIQGHLRKPFDVSALQSAIDRVTRDSKSARTRSRASTLDR